MSIGLNSPRTSAGAFGFKSTMSMWLGPPSRLNISTDFARPAASLPDKWHSAADTRLATQPQADSAWWKSLNDPTLDHLIELAYQQNLPLQIAGLRIVEARAQFGIATGQQFPQFQVASGTAAFAGVSANGPR